MRPEECQARVLWRQGGEGQHLPRAARQCPPGDLVSRAPRSPQLPKTVVRAAEVEVSNGVVSAAAKATTPSNMLDFDELSEIIRWSPGPQSLLRM